MSAFPWEHLWNGLLIACLVMVILYFYQLKRGEADIVDVGWAALMGSLALYWTAFVEEGWLRASFVAVLAAVWAYRLAYHLLTHRAMKDGEDGRYKQMRAGMGGFAQPGFFIFFQVQALVAVLFALPFFVSIFNPREGFAIWDVIGLLIWVTAIVGESIADNQLESWKQNPKNKGKTCRSGMWKYSRHPNYFFEFVHWFAYLFFAIGSPVWYVVLLGPILMYVFLNYVSGIPWTEEQSLRSRGDDYRRYQETTNKFFPGPTKDSAA